MTYTVLIVDDEPTQRRLIQYVVEEKLGYKAHAVGSGQEAIDHILSDRDPSPDAVLLDLVMPKVGGMDVIRAIRPLRPLLPIVVLTMHGDLEKAVQAVKAGANDFLAKPVPIERLGVSLENILRLSCLNTELTRLQRREAGQVQFSDIIGQSQAMASTLALAQRAAASTIPVLVEGPSGVGKELIARAIHGCSDRAGKPFVAVNCGALPENLVESILFGHEKGAFTGALYRTMGKFREADGGTLFLDEVGELKPDLQVKLLRVLQENEIQPVGAKETVKVNVRVLSATNRHLESRVAEGEFREDLFYRLNVFPIAVPPLADRREDIPVLIEHFIHRYAASEHKSVTDISAEALDFLTRLPWPGNVRQIENAVFRAVVMSDHTTLDVRDFWYLAQLGAKPSLTLAGGTQGNGKNGHAGKPAAEGGEFGMLALTNPKGNLRPMTELESEIIEFALRHYDGHMSKIARDLAIGRSTLYRKLSDFGLDAPRQGSA